jgi:predicted CoA-binding protein
MPNVVVIGASRNRSKFGNKAVRAFADKGYEVYPVHPKEPAIEGHKAYRSVLDIPVKHIDMVTIYLPPEIGMRVIEEVAKKGCSEVWLNPGAESDELIQKAESLGLNVIAACSIVGVGSSPSSY